MPRNVYTPEFKARIVIEVLEGARDLEAIAAEHQLNPNMVRNWKAEFLQNAGRAFEQPDKKSKEILYQPGSSQEPETMSVILTKNLQRIFRLVYLSKKAKRES